MNFGELLTKLMKEGVGAPGSQRTWTVEALAARMDVCDKSVKNWRGNVHSCTNPGRLASVLFGSYECQDRKQLLRENEILSAKGNTYAAYASKSTVHGFWDRIFERVEFSESDKSLIEAGKISDAAWTITQANPRLTRDVALSIAHEARCFVFNMKYGIEATIEKDERHVHGIEMWNKEFAEILNDNNIERTKSDLLVVGIGAGFEGVKIYNEFRSVVGVDISEVAVEKAQQAFSECKNVEVIQGIAEELPEYAVNKDIYICLKTYQSSYFDIELSVIECARSLRSGV
ncbi:MAG: class I SAM-dependent methyltransferase [Dechloromonas sp.]|nr:MAG: class I SAM-dependent methyltransferase [Dechloromonas sp.]